MKTVAFRTPAGTGSVARPGQTISAGSFLRDGRITVDGDVTVAVVPDPWADEDSGRTVVHLVPATVPERPLTEDETREAARVVRMILQGSCLDPVSTAQREAAPVSGWLIAREAERIVTARQAAERAEKAAEADRLIGAISTDCPEAIRAAWTAVIHADIDRTGWTTPEEWVKSTGRKVGWTDDQREQAARWIGSEAPKSARSDWSPDYGDPQDAHVGWGLGDD